MTVQAHIVIEQSEDGHWAWRCDCCWVGIGLPDEESAQAEAWLHFERDHLAAEEVSG